MTPLRIRIERGNELTVCLREGEATFERDGEAILDVNREGRWIRGLELLGSVDFNLARAVLPFHPKPPLIGVAGSVTYDEEANAAFFYFSMKKPDTSRPESTGIKYSHSLMPEARFGFDDQGGLLWFRFLLPNEIRSAADFVALIDVPLG